MIIDYPKNNYKSEFEIQSDIYQKLKSLGFDVRGEVRWRDKSYSSGFKQCSFDLVIFKDKKAIAIIEVKNNKKKIINKKSRQFIKYSQFNIPLFYSFSLNDVDDIINKL
jgi:type I site-specific restriction endonuclease